MDAPEKKKLPPLLDELCGAVEELVLSGLTAASRSTVERLEVTFKEASRMKLLRLGSTLRIANEEISRFTSGSAQFSARRLAFFLGRAWLLATGMRRAIQSGDDETLQRLLSTPPTQPVARLKVVTLGVGKRVSPGAFAAFDFRLRALEAAPPVEAGEALVWSCIRPMGTKTDLPAEAVLHLTEKLTFKPLALLEKKVIEFTTCAVTRQTTGPTRLALGETTQLTLGQPFADWSRLFMWDPQPAVNRLAAHRPTPLDLEIELQEEVVLSDWQAGKRRATEEGYDLLPMTAGNLSLEARLDRGPSGEPLRTVFEKLAAAKRDRPPVFGVAHYESCRLMFQPLSALEKDGPNYLTISPEKISQALLVKAMKFT